VFTPVRERRPTPGAESGVTASPAPGMPVVTDVTTGTEVEGVACVGTVLVTVGPVVGGTAFAGAVVVVVVGGIVVVGDGSPGGMVVGRMPPNGTVVVVFEPVGTVVGVVVEGASGAVVLVVEGTVGTVGSKGVVVVVLEGTVGGGGGNGLVVVVLGGTVGSVVVDGTSGTVVLVGSGTVGSGGRVGTVGSGGRGETVVVVLGGMVGAVVVDGTTGTVVLVVGGNVVDVAGIVVVTGTGGMVVGGLTVDWLVKVASVNPSPTRTTTLPPARLTPPTSLFAGPTVMADTWRPLGIISDTDTLVATGYEPATTQYPPGAGPAGTTTTLAPTKKLNSVPTATPLPATLQTLTGAISARLTNVTTVWVEMSP
jgi:hypothetical protein